MSRSELEHLLLGQETRLYLLCERITSTLLYVQQIREDQMEQNLENELIALREKVKALELDDKAKRLFVNKRARNTAYIAVVILMFASYILGSWVG